MALMYQEVLTAIVRLRSNRQSVPDANAFRNHMREALKSADAESRKRGYSGDDIQFATFATVAFLDESVLNSRNAMFADWPRKPLQEELFGTHMAGEVFFQNLEKLITRNDSNDLADVLEVYYLCLLLGFGGRYSMGGGAELRSMIDTIGSKIQRIRGYLPDLSPAWRVTEESVAVGGDPWIKKLIWGAAGCAGLALILFLIFKFSLGSGASDLRALAGQIR
jgi:type VI secretion system protein ImpK